MKGCYQIKFLSAFGARVYVHWSALVASSIMLLFTIRSPVIALTIVCSYFGIIYLHEAGHAYFAKRLGYRAFDICLGIVHGHCIYEAPANEKHESIIAWGGALAQFAVAIPLIVAAHAFPLAQIPGLGPVITLLGYMSAMIAAINLAPSKGLDGEKAWRLIPMLLAKRRKSGTMGNVTRGPWK